MSADAPKILTSKAIQFEDTVYKEVLDDMVKSSVPRMNDAMNRVLTLSTAMVGGTIALLKDDVCAGWWKVAAASCFLIALLVAAIGSIPRTISLPQPRAGDVLDEVKATGRYKAKFLTAALLFLSLGSVSAVVGVAVKVAKPLPVVIEERAASLK